MVQISEDILQREQEVRDYLELFSNQFEVDPNLVRAVITQESRFVAQATSPTGAYGYGQFTGIAAKQVRNVSGMNSYAADLANFQKQDADRPVAGIKATCAYLWWLFYRLYANVPDKKVQLEAALTQYNAGTRAGALVVKHGGYENALPYIKELPKNYQGHLNYAPEVCLWYVAWHDLLVPKAKEVAVPEPAESENPFEGRTGLLDTRYRALIEALKLVDEEDVNVDLIIDVREGLTEVTLIVPGEY